MPQRCVHERAVATGVHLQALLRSSRNPAGPVQTDRAARGKKPSPTDQATAAALYEQLQFTHPAVADDDGQQGPEHQMVLSPERLVWREELQRRIGELARETPKPKPIERRDGTAILPRRPGYRRRG